MPEWNILIADGLNREGQAILNASAQVEDRSGLAADELLSAVPGCHALIVRSRTKVTAAVLEAASALIVVGRAGVGVDNIDLEAARARSVRVVNAPQSTSRAVAEHTLALLLALAREIPRADAALKTGRWIKKDLEGAELDGKTLGVVGLGSIGRLVAQFGAALGMRVIGFDALLSPEAIRQRGAEPAALEELYSQADFISLHVPLTSETRGMINQQAFHQMKRGVRLVCTARGGVIDETALLDAVESGQVSGAALDVFAKEPPGESPLVAHPKVIATPHIAAQTEEAQARAAVDIAEEVLRALRGEPLRWQVV